VETLTERHELLQRELFTFGEEYREKKRQTRAREAMLKGNLRMSAARLEGLRVANEDLPI
jgi:hypothetical protein